MEQKKIQILQSAHKLFWKYGFRRVSIEEVCRDSNVSKMTFYRYFPNKIELAKTVFDKVVDEGFARFKLLMDGAINSEDFMQKFLLLKMESTHSISHDFLVDFYSHPELGLKEYVEQKTRTEWAQVLQVLKNAQKKGFFRKDADLELFLQLAMKMSVIVSDESFLQLYKKPQDLIKALSNLLVYGIAIRPKK